MVCLHGEMFLIVENHDFKGQWYEKLFLNLSEKEMVGRTICSLVEDSKNSQFLPKD